MFDLPIAKEHLCIELDDTSEDSKVNALISVATAAVKNYINRNIYVDQQSLDSAADETGIVMSDDIEHAIKLFLTHFYDNPSITSDMTIKQVPGVEYLLDAHRLINI